MKYFLLLYLLFSTILYSQKTYDFNYLIEYEFQITENSEVQSHFYFTNAGYNKVCAKLSDGQLGYFKLYFHDAKDGIEGSADIPQENVLKYKQILLNCNNIQHRSSQSIYHSNAFKFNINTDTIIDNIAYRRYQMDRTSEKEKKRLKFGVQHYIVENNTQFHKPLISFSWTYDGTMVSSKKIPNGIAREMYFIDPDTKQKYSIYKLKRYTKINTQIIIPKNCL